MSKNTRSTSHADVLLIAIRDPSNLVIELCNTLTFHQFAGNFARCHMHVYAFHHLTCIYCAITPHAHTGTVPANNIIH